MPGFPRITDHGPRLAIAAIVLGCFSATAAALDCVPPYWYSIEVATKPEGEAWLSDYDVQSTGWMQVPPDSQTVVADDCTYPGGVVIVLEVRNPTDPEYEGSVRLCARAVE